MPATADLARPGPAHDGSVDGRALVSGIFEPLRFRNLTVKNRVFRSSISGRFDNEDGSLTQTRVNWDSKFAAGGVGAIISSFAPVSMEGRILSGHAMIDRDATIPLWSKLGEAVHAHGARYLVQLSHAGRQRDLPGIHNEGALAASATARRDPIHGFRCRAVTRGEIDGIVEAFASAAWRAREAGLDGCELHACSGYLFGQFLSSAINDRRDAYGGPLENRARILIEVVHAIRARVGPAFHLQVKLSGTEHNNLLPWEGRGNTADDAQQIARWCEAAGADAIHVSVGSFFPHPLNPPGELPLDALAETYAEMISSGDFGLRNYLTFRYPWLRWAFRLAWGRLKANHPVEGVNLETARRIKQGVSVPVIVTGGFQTASVVAGALSSGACDAVAIARPLVANNDLVRIWASGLDSPERPCSYCNRCLVHAIRNPLGCYDATRYPSREVMVRTIMSIFEPVPALQVPAAAALVTR